MADVIEPSIRRINDRIYVSAGVDNIYTVRYKGEAAPDYVVRNGKEYMIVNSEEYVDCLQNKGAKIVSAKKSGKVIAMNPETDTENGYFTTYTSQGNVEASEKLSSDSVLIARANDEGKPVVDQFGHVNMWQVNKETFNKRYANVPENIIAGTVFTPASLPQDFTQVDRDIAIRVPWGENESLILQTVDNGGYLTSAGEGYHYGIAEEEFNGTYSILEEKTIKVK